MQRNLFLRACLLTTAAALSCGDPHVRDLAMVDDGSGGSVGSGGSGGSSGKGGTAGKGGGGGTSDKGGTAVGGSGGQGGAAGKGGAPLGGSGGTGGTAGSGGMVGAGGTGGTAGKGGMGGAAGSGGMGGTAGSGGVAGAAGPDLVAHWKFDDAAAAPMAADSAGTVSDSLTWTGTPIGSFAAAGKVSGAYDFPGGDSPDRFFSAKPSTDLDSITGGVTIAAWYYRPSSATGNYQDMLLFRNATGGGRMLGLLIHYNRSFNWVGPGTAGTAANAIALDKWIHLAATYDVASQDLHLYLDGTAVYSDLTHHAPLGASDQDLLIGGGWGTNWPTNARLDDLRLYKRALTASEVAALAAP